MGFMGKKLRIGVLINAIFSDYSASVIDGISKYCKEHDCVQVVFSILRGNNSTLYDFQYDAIKSFVSPNNIDVLVIASASLSNLRTSEEFLSDIENLPNMVTVSLGIDVPYLPSVVVDSKEAIRSVIKHIITFHDRKKFLLMHADSRCEESYEREVIFKKTLKECGVRFNEKHSLTGNFVLDYAYASMDQYLKKNKKRDFDAIFCCNDEMALGCIACLEDHNIHVPEDVSVVGYDNVDYSLVQDLDVSTVDQRIVEQAYQAAALAHDIYKSGEVKDRLKVIKAEPVLRRSCGCIKRTKLTQDNKTEKGYITHKIHHKSSVQMYMLHYFMLESQDPVPLEKLYRRLAYCFSLFDIASAMLVLYDRPVFYKDAASFVVPEKATLKMAYSVKKGILKPDLHFDPSDNMIPDGFVDMMTPCEVAFPLFSENYQYGYFIMQMGQYEKIFYQTVFELIAKEITSSIKVTQSELERDSLKTKNITLEEYSEKLQVLSRTDEMTQIYNRRGFYEAAQNIIDKYTALGKKGLVIYGDMDGLKSINDTFGHDAGDRAIKAEAEILKEIFRSTDIVGRLGGDEFAIVAPEMTKKDFIQIKKRLTEKCKEYNDKEVDPFVLSISIGFSQFDAEDAKLEKLLDLADQSLYIEKRAKKEKKAKKAEKAKRDTKAKKAKK